MCIVPLKQICTWTSSAVLTDHILCFRLKVCVQLYIWRVEIFEGLHIWCFFFHPSMQKQWLQCWGFMECMPTFQVDFVTVFGRKSIPWNHGSDLFGMSVVRGEPAVSSGFSCLCQVTTAVIIDSLSCWKPYWLPKRVTVHGVFLDRCINHALSFKKI